MKELHSSIKYVRGLSPVVATDNTALTTEIIDTLGMQTAEFVIATGTLADADATFTVSVAHGNNSALSDTEATPDSDLIGTEAAASFTFAADNVTRKIGYKCTKRYVQLTITPANNTGNAPLAVVVAMVPRHQPAA